ncbi:NADH dehydrogenase I chain G [Salmonella enterica subsp. enterica]|uniref:NADH dehydrogenase I chain G n=1 Tax=Salmonella enterica I TaxID=59201 RepID=A0A3S4F4S9_SALET|nr:NADH dehydrogenase I chain G [Salmonella enterica subsp. enterica]
MDPAYYDNKTIMLESWRWLHSLHSTVENREVDWTQLDHVIDAVIAAMPQFAGIKDAAPDATFRHSWAEAGARTASLQRSYGDARQISACMNHVSRRIKTPCSPSQWKGITNRQPRDLKFRSPGRRAGTLRRREQIPG